MYVFIIIHVEFGDTLKWYISFHLSINIKLISKRKWLPLSLFHFLDICILCLLFLAYHVNISIVFLSIYHNTGNTYMDTNKQSHSQSRQNNMYSFHTRPSKAHHTTCTTNKKHHTSMNPSFSTPNSHTTNI